MVEQVGKFLGQQFGNYTLTRVLGSGGFAEVYQGMHKHLETQAAIKVLQAPLNEADQQNFLAEARIVARLNHPHIVHILEFGIENDIPYLVMNYAAHGTLRQHLPRGVAHSPETFLPALKQIASALQYAHNQNLIHRDIKPENMLLDEQDSAFLSDFGIATQARSSRSQTIEEVIGTVVYMAPEQLQGRPRPASDQYALGIVVYEWLCGVRPFQGSNFIMVATQHVNTPPRPLREHVPMLQPAIELVVLTALAKDYHQRYARVQDFVVALEQAHLTGRALRPQDFVSPSVAPQFLPASPFAIPPQSLASTLPPKHAVSITPLPSRVEGNSGSNSHPLFSRRVLIGGGLAAVLLAGGGISWWATTHLNTGTATTTTSGSSTSFKGLYLPQAKLVRISHYPTKIASVAWSKESKYVASVENDAILQVWEATTGITLWSATVTASIRQLTWSPDGQFLALSSGNASTLGHILIYNAASHKLHATSSFPGGDLVWSPDSRFLASANPDINTDVATWDGISGHAFASTFSGTDVTEALTWSPDGKYIATGNSSPDGEFGYVMIWKRGNGPNVLPQVFQPRASGPVESVSWSSSHENVIASAGSESVEIWDMASLGKTYHKSYPQFSAPVIWSPDGRYVASATPNDTTIRVWNGSTAAIASACQGHTDSITAIAWSSDGNYLASTSKDTTVRIWQVRS